MKIGKPKSGRAPAQRRVARAAGRGRRRRGFHHTRRPCTPLARPWVRPLRRRPARPCPAPAFPNFDPHRARGTGRGIAGQPGRGRARRCARLPARSEVRVCGGSAVPPRAALRARRPQCRRDVGWLQWARPHLALWWSEGGERRAGRRCAPPKVLARTARAAVWALSGPLGALCGPIAARMRLALPPRACLGLAQQGGPADASRSTNRAGKAGGRELNGESVCWECSLGLQIWACCERIVSEVGGTV